MIFNGLVDYVVSLFILLIGGSTKNCHICDEILRIDHSLGKSSIMKCVIWISVINYSYWYIISSS